MAALIAGVARPEDEAMWLEAAESRTVRQMRVLVAQAVAALEAGLLPFQHAASAVAAAAPTGLANGVGPEVGGEPGDADRCSSTQGDPDTCAPGEPGAGKRAGSSRGAVGGVLEIEGCSHAPEWDCAAFPEHESETRTLTCRVPQEDAWLFEATRLLFEQMGVRGLDAQCEALLAEGQGTLLGSLPKGALALDELERSEAVEGRWQRRLVYGRVEAEASSEGRFCGSLWRQGEPSCCAGTGGACSPARASHVASAAAAHGMGSLNGLSALALDGHVRELSRALARHELDMSRLVLRLYRADGWRRLGYATEGQYARERLGMSASSLAARRSLALRLEELPLVADGLGGGQIGVEAALQVVRVATARTQGAWVERARQRTIKHLREEVSAALIAVRYSGELDCLPPEDAELAAFHELEQAVVSGRAQRAGAEPSRPGSEARGGTGEKRRLSAPTSDERRAWFVMLAGLKTWLEGGLQMSAAPAATAVGSLGGSGSSPGAGRVMLRLRMARSTYTWWRELERQAQRWLPPGMSWLRFLCLSSWQAWKHILGLPKVAYAGIYARDRYRCMSPVCSRRDVTPHHIRFRSAGGSDDPANIGSFCVWCHLYGIHGGRLRAIGTAEHLRWELGAPGAVCLVVDGRERLVA